MPTRVESLAWTKPERNWLDKMWLDSGMEELYLTLIFLDHETIVEGDALTPCLNSRTLLLLSLHQSRME